MDGFLRGAGLRVRWNGISRITEGGERVIWPRKRPRVIASEMRANMASVLVTLNRFVADIALQSMHHMRGG